MYADDANFAVDLCVCVYIYIYIYIYILKVVHMWPELH